MEKLGSFEASAIVGWKSASAPWEEEDAVADAKCDYYMGWRGHFAKKFVVDCKLGGDLPFMDKRYCGKESFSRVFHLEKGAPSEFGDIDKNQLRRIKFVSKHHLYDFTERDTSKEEFAKDFADAKHKIETALAEEVEKILENDVISE